MRRRNLLVGIGAAFAAGCSKVAESEPGAALLRRFIPLLTSKHAIFINDIQVASINQRFRWFTKEFDVELHSRDVDQRYVLACALLALIAEARREDRAR